MKRFHQNLLIVLAACLCALCAYQWRVQSAQRAEIDALAQAGIEKDAMLRASSNAIATADHQIARMDEEIAGLKSTVASNEQFIVARDRELRRLQGVEKEFTDRLDRYRQAVETLEARLREAYDGIKKQNATLLQVVAQRDEVVSKLNASTEDRNAVAAKYNDLVKDIEQQRRPGGKSEK